MSILFLLNEIVQSRRVGGDATVAQLITRHRSPSRRLGSDLEPLRAPARRFDPAIETIFKPAGGSLPKMSGSEVAQYDMQGLVGDLV